MSDSDSSESEADAAANPLRAVQSVLDVCGLRANRNRFITLHNITSLEDLALWEPEDAKSVIKMYNDRHGTGNNYLGFTIQVKVQGLLFWIKDQRRRQRPLLSQNFTAEAMSEAIKSHKIEKESKDADTAKIEVGKIQTDLNWFDWAESFESLCESKHGVNQVPLSYVIRRDKGAGWTPDMAPTESQ